MERTERVPHSPSLDGGYGVISNAKPTTDQPSSPSTPRQSAKKCGHNLQALGLAESTGGQWYGAVTGKFETAESMEQEGDIAANPIVGVPAYLLTNNPAFAQEAANTLGLVLATGDYVNSGFGRQSIAKGVDMLMNAASVFGTGCKE